VNYKKIFFSFIFFFLLGLISISLFIFYTKAYKSETLINSQIYQKSHHGSLSDRITKFYILQKKENLEYVVMGTSSTWVFDPKLIEKKYNFKGALNISQAAAKIIEHYKFILWILENKKDVKEIIINLEPFSFNELQYSRLPYEIEIKIKDKIANFLSFLTFKDAIKVFLTKLNLMSKISPIEERGIGDFYFNSGLRYYPDYYKRLNNNELMEKMVNELRSSNIKYYKESFDNQSFKYLKEILSKTKKKNIKVTLFFDPVSYIFLQSNDYEYLYAELKIIKKIVNELDQEVLYFNNLNEINYSLNLFEDGHSHYNYDAAKLVLSEILENDLRIGTKITKENFQDILIRISEKTKSKKINALY